MYYLKNTHGDFKLIEGSFGPWEIGKNIEIFYLKVEENGFINRELGFDNRGRMVHKCYSDDGGAFDDCKIKKDYLKNDINKDEFEKLWGQPSKVQKVKSKQKPGLKTVLLGIFLGLGLLVGIPLLLAVILHFFG